MRLIMMPVIVSIGVVMFAQRDKMLDLYRAAYPVDPAKAEALDDCSKNRNFDRLDSGDRAACYARTYGKDQPAYGRVDAAPLIATPQPVYPYNPSHLSGSDVRREEANSAYLRAIQQPPPPVAVAVPTPPHPIVHPVVPAHHVAARHRPVHPHAAAAKPATAPR
ncbi:MAG TPA: hypothetical protein VGG57_10845 [Stellaceae bacterium]|jgi:hypothetical protein